MADQHNFVDGDPGASLFHRPTLIFFQEDDTAGLLNKALSLADDRLIAIVRALIVEDRLDKCLRAIMPGFSLLEDVTYARKVDILDALNFVPPILLREARIIGSIRNAFAHSLDHETFVSLAPGLLSELVQVYRLAYSRLIAVEAVDPGIQFTDVSFHCTAGLGLYGDNLKRLNATLRSQAFVDSLEADAAADNRRVLAELSSEAPLSVEDNDRYVVRRYRRGYTEVTEKPIATTTRGAEPPTVPPSVR